MGWTGICVEANPSAAEECRRNRCNSTVVQAAVGGNGGVADSTRFAVRTGSPGAAMFSRVASSDTKGAVGKCEIVNVPYRSLNDILHEHAAENPSIDLLSIDIEGMEYDVLRSLDWDRWRPALLIVESNDNDVLDFLTTLG